jgi:hypothetical protein
MSRGPVVVIHHSPAHTMAHITTFQRPTTDGAQNHCWCSVLLSAPTFCGHPSPTATFSSSGALRLLSSPHHLSRHRIHTLLHPPRPLHKRAVSQVQSAQAVFTACSIQLLPFVFRILSMPPQSTAFLQGSSASATLAQAVRFISVKLLSLFERAKAYPDSIQKRVLLVARALLR